MVTGTVWDSTGASIHGIIIMPDTDILSIGIGMILTGVIHQVGVGIIQRSLCITTTTSHITEPVAVTLCTAQEILDYIVKEMV